MRRMKGSSYHLKLAWSDGTFSEVSQSFQDLKATYDDVSFIVLHVCYNFNCLNSEHYLLLVIVLATVIDVVSLNEMMINTRTRWQRIVVVSAIGLIHEVNRHWARLVLG